MRRTLLILLAYVLSPASADVYKWVDEEGVVHFSDQPHPSAEKIELPPATVYSPPPVKKPAPPPEDEEPAVMVNYKSFSIVKPENEETIRSSEGVASVLLSLEPALQEGHTMRLYVDGRLARTNLTGTEVVLRGLIRGAHTVRAVLVDEKGRKLQETQTVSFFLHKASILHKKPN